MNFAIDNRSAYLAWRALKPGDQVYVARSVQTTWGSDGDGSVSSRCYGDFSATSLDGYTLRTVTGTGVAAGLPFLDYDDGGVVRVIAWPRSEPIPLPESDEFYDEWAARLLLEWKEEEGSEGT